MTMYRKDPEILRALDRIDPNELSYTEWIKIGMALKNEGFECSDWENWSRKDIRFKEGECAYKWKGFNAIRKKITKRSLFWYARQFGYEASQQFEDEYPDLVFAEPPSLPLRRGTGSPLSSLSLISRRCSDRTNTSAM